MFQYDNLGAEIGRLVMEKQAAYGDSFSKAGDIMRILYPDGVAGDQLDDALTVVRVLDKLFRIATDRDALGESPWRDVAGYALLSVARVEGKPEVIKAAAEAQMTDLLKQLNAAAKPKVAESVSVTYGQARRYPNVPPPVAVEKCGHIGDDYRGKPDTENPCALEKGHGHWHRDENGDEWFAGSDGEW